LKPKSTTGIDFPLRYFQEEHLQRADMKSGAPIILDTIGCMQNSKPDNVQMFLPPFLAFLSLHHRQKKRTSHVLFI
jgi:hypothetical protein